MTSPMGFADARERVRNDDSEKWDEFVSARELRLMASKVVLPEVVGVMNPRALSPTPWATSQLCERLGIPSAYFIRCPDYLKEEQFAYWACRLGRGPTASCAAQSPGPTWRLRAKGETLRAALSDQYTPLDHSALVDLLPDGIERRFSLEWFALSDESLHLRIVDPHLTVRARAGDDLSVGIHIANSEVGKRAISIDALVYRLVCSNGLVALVKGKSLLRRRHVHLDSARLREEVDGAIRRAIGVAEVSAQRFVGTTTRHVKDPGRLIDRLRNRWGFTQGFAETVKAALSAERASDQHTLFGLINALTAAAQGLPPDERYEVELLAGSLIGEYEPGPINETGVIRIPIEEEPSLALA